MDLRSSWMTERLPLKDFVINKAKIMFDKQRNESAEGYDVLIDGVSERVLIQSHTNPINENKLTKHIHCDINSLIKTGSIINWNDDDYLVITQIESNMAYLSAKIQKTNHILKFYNTNQQLVQCPVIVTNKVSDVDTDKYLILPDGKFKIILSANDDTNEITRGKRFIFNNSAWKAIFVNKMIDGIIELTVEEDEIRNADDMVNEIADNTQNVYTVQILNNDADLLVDNTLQLNIEAKTNGQIDNSPSLSFTSSNEAVATVDSVGLITGVVEGSCSIEVSYHGVIDSININVVASVIDNYSISIQGDSEILYDSSKTYIGKVYNNGVLDETKAVTFSVDNNNCSIKSQDGHSCVILAGLVTDVSTILTATLDIDNSVQEHFAISVVGLW